MDTLRIAHLIQLAVSPFPNPETRLKEIADRYVERNLLATKGFAAVSAVILTGTILPWFGKPNTKEEMLVGSASALGTFLCAIVFFLRSRQYATLYSHALSLLGFFYRIRNLLLALGFR